MRLKLWILSASAVVLPLLCACSNDSPDTPEINPDDNVPGQEVTPGDVPDPKAYTTINLSATQAAAKQANNDFAVALMKDVMEMKNGESTVLSPFSLYSALAMAANGDNDKTRDQTLQVLGFGSGDAELAKLNDFNSLLMTQLPVLDSRAYALVSNSMWFGNNLQLLPAFVTALSQYYNADVKSLATLNDDNARKLINAWCSQKTQGLIPEFLKMNLNCDLALLNATYFKGMWSNGFNEDFTRKAPFNNIDGSTAQVDMMKSLPGTYSYTKTADAEIIGLPYGNGNFRMMCILPDRSSNIYAYADRMTAASLVADFATAKEERCVVNMPKFDVGSNQNITELLKKKGLNSMFDIGFNAMALDGTLLRLSQAIQQTRISTDEGGTIGAAVSFLGLDTALDPDAPSTQPVEVTLDRPFLFVIEETSTGTMLFIGAVTKL